jgi:hypothetical protein
MARTEELIARQDSDVERWRQKANLATQWDERARIAATLIGAGPCRVLDLGAGHGAPRVSGSGCQYTSADIAKRSDDCLVIDLNKHEFPRDDYDVSVPWGFWSTSMTSPGRWRPPLRSRPN